MKNLLIKTIMQRAINVSDLLIFISEAVKKTFQNNFKFEENKSIVIYNGINRKYLENIATEKKTEITNIVFVGRLEKVKGVDLLINAFGEVYKRNNQTQLTIVGDGKERKSLEKLAKKVKDSEKTIKFVGRQNNVIEWLDRAKIFVYPSIWEEGFGISVVEAMARGCIPITFRKGGLTEIIKDGKNGILVNEVSSDALAQAIIKVILMDDKRKKIMREEAIKTAKRFTIDNTIKNIEKSLNKIL